MSTTESPVQKSRGRHRANKSTPNTNAATPSRPHSNTQQAPRSPNNVVTPPQSPKAQQQTPPNASAKKNKRKPKPRPRDVNTDVQNHTHHSYDSPNVSSNDESNAFPPTPTRGVLSTPTKAYAGPNFHSSPNPSALPVPSWFSKSVPVTPSAGTSLQAMLELSSEETLSQSLEEPESHLQKLFRADKEEKAKRRVSVMTTMPMLATLAQGSLETPRRQCLECSDSSFTDVFTMDNEKKTPTPPTEMRPPRASRALTEVEARRQTDALRSFLNQPHMSPVGVETVVERPANQPTAPFTPAKRHSSPPQHYSAPRAQTQTPAKKVPAQQTSHFVMTPSKGPRGQQSGSPQTSTPARDYHHNRSTYHNKNEIKNDSVLQLTEMELYLRRVLNLENRAIAAPAVAS